MYPMTNHERDVQRKLRMLRHAEKSGQAARTCRYFGVGRSSFYRWKAAYEQRGEAGLINEKPIPKNPANQTPPEIVEKVLHLRSKYHLGAIRIVWYLARYHARPRAITMRPMRGWLCRASTACQALSRKTSNQALKSIGAGSGGTPISPR
jgi:transposase